VRTKVFVRILSAILFGVLGASSGRADDGGHVQARLVSEVRSVQPGSPFWTGVLLKMDPHWHTYWRYPGDSGLPTKIKWKLPAGFSAGDIQWPYPMRIELPPLVSYGYEDEILLPVQLTPPASLKPGADVTLAARVDWLECAEICIPGKADVSLTLPVGKDASAPDPAAARLFADIRARLPLAQSEWTFAASSAGDKLYITAHGPSGETSQRLNFFPFTKAQIEEAAPQTLSRDGEAYVLELTKSELSTGPVAALEGLVVSDRGWRGENSERALTVRLPVTPGAPRAATGGLTVWLAMLFAAVGGLILNLMPCVLPVLSVKILGFVNQAAGDKAEIRRHGLVFAGGVILSFLAMGGALLLLRAGGEQLGWGFHLQSPRVVAGLAVLFFIFGLNLLGLFEIGAGLVRTGGLLSGKTGLSGSFLSGVLAVIVATPCTAPFMGSALGFAVTQPALASLAVFASLGVGMALPYLILSFSPPLLRLIPRPGAWMETFKQIMGFPLLATVIWLLWVLGRQTDVQVVAGVMIGLLVAAVGLWMWGKNFRARWLALLFVAAGVGLSVAAPAVSPSGQKAAAAQGGEIPWEPFSEERVKELRAQGRPVFVDFTAAWCLTCQVNERVAINKPQVVEKLKTLNVATLKADWTSRDENITRALQSFGRTGVPFYVLYPKDPGKAPLTLPEILTPAIVLDALDEI